MRKCCKENKRTGGWVVMWVEKDCLQNCTQFYSLEVQGRNVFSNPPSPPLLPILLLNIWKDPWLSASPFHSPQKWWWAGGTWKETSWNCLIDILVGAGHQLPVLTSRGQIAAGWYRASCGGRSLSEPTSQKPDKWEMEKKKPSRSTSPSCKQCNARISSTQSNACCHRSHDISKTQD